MKPAKIREQSDAELIQTAADLSKQIVEHRVKRPAEGETRSTALASTLRRDLARVKTILRERSKA